MLKIEKYVFKCRTLFCLSSTKIVIKFQPCLSRKKGCKADSSVSPFLFYLLKASLDLSLLRQRSYDAYIIQIFAGNNMICTFKQFSNIPCGLSKYTSSTVCIGIDACCRDITRHLKNVNISTKCVSSEKELILARCGLFDEDSQGFTVCPAHRDVLGVFWKQTKKCEHPLHGNSKRKADRGINLQVSKEIMERWNVFICIGTGQFLTVFIHVHVCIC